MLSTYNPWGKPGHGAPMPGAFRKTKWILSGLEDENEVNSALSLGRPGHGAPLRTPSGKTTALIKSDPLIRFQFHESARKAVNNDLRYKATPIDRENYRKELDAIVQQKKKNSIENEDYEAPLAKETVVPHYWRRNYLNEKDVWNKPGPGGRAWRDPRKIGANFFKSMGWTNNLLLNKMENSDHCIGEQIYEITGGVELVPILAKHRMSIRCPLPTTDITKMSRISNEVSKIKNTAPEYFQQLCRQINEKKKLKEKKQKEEIAESKKHFETWKGFWGRPGHGAPRGLSQREKLEYLLYQSPSRRITSCTAKSP